ncbi:hypothetical protein M231_03342 [Tremella mesenterica]|uniref:LCCL domain-containing protein n=1 Tax=Tremella mesenterica TaxID=5217 RepID=A0A4Q1BNF7_TREME|nr:hypothetical protein M231_03342 [Tremella mesenterica]
MTSNPTFSRGSLNGQHPSQSQTRHNDTSLPSQLIPPSSSLTTHEHVLRRNKKIFTPIRSFVRFINWVLGPEPIPSRRWKRPSASLWISIRFGKKRLDGCPDRAWLRLLRKLEGRSDLNNYQPEQNQRSNLDYAEKRSDPGNVDSKDNGVLVEEGRSSMIPQSVKRGDIGSTSTSTSAGSNGPIGIVEVLNRENHMTDEQSSFTSQQTKSSQDNLGGLYKQHNFTQGVNVDTEEQLQNHLDEEDNVKDDTTTVIGGKKTRINIISIIFGSLWLIGFIFLIRQQYYVSNLPIVTCDTAPWNDWPVDTCGLDARECTLDWFGVGMESSDNQTAHNNGNESGNGVTIDDNLNWGMWNDWKNGVRCMGGCKDVVLGNERWVGDKRVNGVPLVIGGEGVYRADSWLCASALHSSLISPFMGGSFQITPTIYPSSPSSSPPSPNISTSTINDITPIPFSPPFPGGFTLSSLSSQGTSDLHPLISTYNAISLFLFTLFIPSPPYLFSILLLLGFLQIVLISDPPSIPPDWSYIIASALPVALIGYWIYKVSFRRTLYGFSHLPVELALWKGLGYWIGIESNDIFSKLPITRLAEGGFDGAKKGGVVLLVVICLVGLGVVVLQYKALRSVGLIRFYLIRYIPLGLLLLLIALLPTGYSVHIHHYMLALLLFPIFSLPTRISLIGQAFALGWFLDGIGRWGWDSLLETKAQLVGDAYLGSLTPTFFPVNQTTISWSGLNEALVSIGITGYSVLIDDVLRLSNVSITEISLSEYNLSLGEHYFRLAVSGLLTLDNFLSTWIDRIIPVSLNNLQFLALSDFAYYP